MNCSDYQQTAYTHALTGGRMERDSRGGGGEKNGRHRTPLPIRACSQHQNITVVKALMVTVKMIMAIIRPTQSDHQDKESIKDLGDQRLRRVRWISRAFGARAHGGSQLRGSPMPLRRKVPLSRLV